MSAGNFGQTRKLTEKFDGECGYYVVVLLALPFINRGCGYPASTTFSKLNILRPFLGYARARDCAFRKTTVDGDFSLED